jgi:hypothetical protein
MQPYCIQPAFQQRTKPALNNTETWQRRRYQRRRYCGRQKTFSLQIFGKKYTQGGFGYQRKCRTDLRQRFATLTG